MLTLSLKIVEKLSCSSIVAILLLLIIQINAAPIVNHVRLLSYESGRYVTIDSNTGSISASSSNIDATTLFVEETGRPPHSQRFKSDALDQYLSIIKDETSSAHYAVTALQTESSGQSGSSSGSDDNASGSGVSEPTSSDSVEIFQNWIVDTINGPFSTVRIPVGDNVNCYLAFEYTGEPVADPCSISPDDTRAAISLDYV